jgi:PncC family amidohydrolase
MEKNKPLHRMRSPQSGFHIETSNVRASAFKLAAKLGTKCIAKNITLAVAESCTGGMVGAAITSVAGSSQYFRGGVIAYDNDVKMSLLRVPAPILNRCGAVSSQVVKAMAQGAQKRLKTDYAIAISGVAGPGGGTKKKPVGLVWIGIAAKAGVRTFRERFAGDRESIRKQAVVKSLQYMLRLL